MKISFDGEICDLVKSKYYNGRIALMAIGDDCLCTMTIDLSWCEIEKDEAFIDIGHFPGVIGELEKAKVINEPPIRHETFNYINYPLYKINF